MRVSFVAPKAMWERWSEAILEEEKLQSSRDIAMQCIDFCEATTSKVHAVLQHAPSDLRGGTYLQHPRVLVATVDMFQHRRSFSKSSVTSPPTASLSHPSTLLATLFLFALSVATEPDIAQIRPHSQHLIIANQPILAFVGTHRCALWRPSHMQLPPSSCKFLRNGSVHECPW